MKDKILVVDDELDMLNLLKRSLEPELDCLVDTAANAEEALKLLNHGWYDLVLADIKMPGMGGLELLRIMRDEYPETTVIMMTAYGDIDTAVEAMKSGAYDFITKPFEHDSLIFRLEKGLERSRLKKENLRLQKNCGNDYLFEDLVGKSRKMKQVYEAVQMVAKTDMTVLIRGESGTGKELVARAVHALSPRKHSPFVAVNCPTVPENILESELFGYRKGAFTNAVRDKKGLFQEAGNGTIFLDEIGDISPSIQTKLLRVLQEKEFKPLGASKSIRVDVRVIASTNQDLEEKIKQSQFREDFFYRLNVLPINLPPLRERQEDIPLIANHLLEKHCALLDKPLKSISPRLLEIMINRTWEGNVRELENIIIQGILYASDEEIKPGDVGFTEERPPVAEGEPDYQGLMYKEAKEQTLMHFNQTYIGKLLQDNQGNVTKAAQQCGLERQALQQIMRRYGIKAEDFRTNSFNHISQ